MKAPSSLGVVMVVGGLGLGFTSAAMAQGPVEMEATAPEKPPQFRFVEPTPATREATRPREADFYREDVRLRHEPAFIEPFLGRTEGGTKYGLSGWTAPSTPVGSLVSQQPWTRIGWIALGITFVWDSHPPEPARRVSDPR